MKSTLQLLSSLFLMIIMTEGYTGTGKPDKTVTPVIEPLTCSSTIENYLVTNELNVSETSGTSGLGYIELYVNTPISLGGKIISYSDDGKKNSVTVALDDGTATVYKDGVEVLASNYSSSTVPAGSFIIYPESLFGGKNALDKNYGEILIQDSGSLEVIAYFRYGVSLANKSQLWDVESSCSSSFDRNDASDNGICTKPDGSHSLWQVCGSTKGSTNDEVAIVAGGFNCVESGAGISGSLYSKTTEQSFVFDVLALASDASLEEDFASVIDHSVTVELVDASSGDCASYPNLSTHNINFTDAELGILATNSMTLGAAYSRVMCRITDATGETDVVACSTDSFSIRPANFTTVTSTMDNTGSGAGVTAKAGSDSFTITVSTGTVGYNGTPKYNTTLHDHNNIEQDNKLSGNFASADVGTGIAVGSDFKYDEVGLIKLIADDIYDDTFTNVDKINGDCIVDSFSNVPVNGKIGCGFSYAGELTIGRFIPDHFDVSLNSPVFKAANSSFTYLGQPFMYSTIPTATITAKNASGQTTQNYKGSYWKVDPTDVDKGIAPNYAETSHALTVIDTSVPAMTINSDGSGVLNFSDTTTNILAVNKSGLTAPFDAEIALSFNLVDLDGVTVANVNDVAQVNPVVFGETTSGAGISFAGYKEQRWGRVSLANVYGSELTELPVPFNTEYYNGHNFIKNFADNSTQFNLVSMSLNNGSITQTADQSISIGSTGSTTATLTNSPFNAGDAELKFSAANAYGYVDLSIPTTSNSWLLFDWDGNGVHDNLPTARINFGLYKGNEKQIYFREVY